MADTPWANCTAPVLSSMLMRWGKRGLVVKSGTWNAARHRLKKEGAPAETSAP